jgi:uncharacterized membrane protein YfcA
MIASMLSDILVFIAIGIVAQLVDGAIGMAYGLISTTVLLSLGFPPATASASVHTAEIFTTGASGYSHWRLGNVDMSLFRRLALPGIVGGAIGAYLLTEMPVAIIQPIVSVYLGLMGGLVLWKALRKRPVDPQPPRHVSLLGLTGGFLDAIGGGGWGPMVASTLVGGGTRARFAIGTTNAAEFLVTATISATFVFTIGLDLWPIIVGLVIGGVVAAPFAAYVARGVPERPLMILVGVVIIILSLRGVLKALAI